VHARRTAYLPGLDGLRALAVAAVMLSHSALGWPRGGFLGVEIFFVISGFIITRGLLLERGDTDGVGLRKFWMRRVRRLLPALGVLCLAVLGYAVAFAPERLAGLRTDLPAALGFVTNWHMILASESYFGTFEEPSLVRHLWSLAVEEQYYVIWPLAILGATAVFRPAVGRDGAARYRGLALVIGLAAVASILATALMDARGVDPMRLYYGTDTRASGLLLGSALACLWTPGLHTERRGRNAIIVRRLDRIGLAGAVLLAVLLLGMHDAHPLLYRGGFAATDVATLALIVAATTRGTRLAALAGRTPLRWIGQRSYGLYLWHWPVMLVLWPEGAAGASTLLVVAVQVAVTVGLAEASYRWIEMPVRGGVLGRWWAEMVHWLPSSRRERRTALVTGAAAAVLITAAVGWPLLLAQSPDQPGYFATQSVRIVSPAPAAVTTSEEPVVVSPASAVPVASATGGAVTLSPADAAPPGIAAPASRPSGTVAPTEAPGVSAAPSSAGSTSSSVPEQATPTGASQPALVVPGGVTALGDSVMLGAAPLLAAGIAGIEVDAEVGRQATAMIAALRERATAGTLGQVIVLHVGNNGVITRDQFEEIMDVAGDDRRIVFLSLTVPRAWAAPNNEVIRSGIARHGNAVLADWSAACLAEPDALWTDGVHLSSTGASLYFSVIAAQLGL